MRKWRVSVNFTADVEAESDIEALCEVDKEFSVMSQADVYEIEESEND